MEPTSPRAAGALDRILALRGDVAALDVRLPAARLTRVPREAQRPPGGAASDVVLVMGMGRGRALAADLGASEYERLNRDEAGWRLADLLPALAARLAAGARAPRSPEDVVLVPGVREFLHRHLAEGRLLLGLSWEPEVASGARTADEVDAIFARTHELLGAEIDAVWCPHADGPPVCWCRKPLPGLGVVLIERHRLDAAQCLYLGRDTSDRAFAAALGLEYASASDLLAPE